MTPGIDEVTARNCRCCGKRVLIMCETDFCGERCRSGKCGHAVAELAEIIRRKQEEIRPIWDELQGSP